MVSTSTLPEILTSAGIADLTGLWPVDTVNEWNRRLDPYFASHNGQRRSYASADVLVDTGIFAEIFSEPARQLIAGIHPSALLYHCHCYETAAKQAKPHIHRDKPQGWHRDTETLKAYTPNFPTFISIFILLSTVGDDDGPFEFSPYPPHRGMRPRADIVRLVGPPATAAIWNRSYFHRAAANRGPARRRIMKISFQPADLPNDRIGIEEFDTARAHLNNPALYTLIDHHRLGTTQPLPDHAATTAAHPLAASGKNELSRTQAGIIRAQTVGLRLMAAAGMR